MHKVCIQGIHIYLNSAHTAAYCPNCQRKVLLLADCKMQQCPNCGTDTIPCSLCPECVECRDCEL